MWGGGTPTSRLEAERKAGRGSAEDKTMPLCHRRTNEESKTEEPAQRQGMGETAGRGAILVILCT